MQITVTSATSRDSGACVSLAIRISDGVHFEKKELLLLTEQYIELGVHAKDEISEEVLESIEYASAVCEAYRTGLRVLNFGACSKKRMIQKLRTKGIDAEAASLGAQMLSDKGYINEEQDALRAAELCLTKHWGMRRICAHLYEKGFSKEAVSLACEAISDFDFARSCAEHMRRHRISPPKEPSERKKLFASLARLGFSPTEIKEAMMLLNKNDE